MSRMGRKLPLLAGVFATAAWCQSAGPGRAELRLRTPLTSYSSPRGSTFQSVVIAPYEVDGRVMLPAGTVVTGAVRGSKKVGIGIVRERAALDLDFREYQLPDGRRFPLSGKLHAIENSRESVNARGQIKGILAASNPQSFLGGIWSRPSTALFQRSLIGLTGLAGRIVAGLELGHFGACAVLVLRVATFRLPEPEIQLPVGTEMKIDVTGLPGNAPSFPVPESSSVSPELADWLQDQPYEVKKRNGQLAEDIVNVAFSASEKQLVDAFAAAGWVEASKRTKRSVSYTYAAYSRQAGYAEAPASRLEYEGREPDLIFEKSFNTVAKRHHVRVWRTPSDDGGEVWLGAATHDVGIVFAPSVKLSHRIDPRIDLERGKVIDDLSFAGCSDPVGYVDREDAARHSGAGIATDGRLAVLFLGSCAEREPVAPVELKSPVSRLVRLARRMVLDSRQYVLRENPYYWGYRAIRWKREDSSRSSVLDE